MTKNIISVEVLEAESLRETLGECVLKMSSDSLVVLKGTRRNNVYYLIGNAVTGLASSGQLDDDTRSWHSELGQIGLKSDQALVGASTCNLEAHKNCILDKKVKFGTDTYHLHGLLELVHVDVWDPTRTASLGSHKYFVSIVDHYSRRCWVYPMRQRVETLYLLVKWNELMENHTGRKIKVL